MPSIVWEVSLAEGVVTIAGVPTVDQAEGGHIFILNPLLSTKPQENETHRFNSFLAKRHRAFPIWSIDTVIKDGKNDITVQVNSDNLSLFIS